VDEIEEATTLALLYFFIGGLKHTETYRYARELSPKNEAIRIIRSDLTGSEIIQVHSEAIGSP
jgi:hypothetical protein